jgi:exopolyphosphatase/guanosine-5'-triphosphate,3'-diphosphate pyrophosphatase
MPLVRLASIDVGSNTTRLLLAQPLPGQTFRPLRVERIITRLGGNFSPGKRLDKFSMERTLEALRSFAELLDGEGVEKVVAVGTGVLRKAKNRSAFVRAVKEQTGFSLRILSGQEEAQAMLRGVLGPLKDQTTPRLITDVGGGSTEMIWMEGQTLRKTVSLELGAVGLSERFLFKDPPSSAEMEALKRFVQAALRGVRRQWEKEGWHAREVHPHLVGTAGTVTTLGAIDLSLSLYDPRKVTGHRISLSRLRRMYRRLSSLSLKERGKIPGLEKGREDLILAGSAILLNLLEVFERSALEVIDSGLLEGILLEGMAETGNP